MKQFFGMSQTGDLKEAVRGLSKPQFLMLMSNSDQFESHVSTLQDLYPDVPSIGCIGMSYDTRIVEKGVGVAAFYDGVRAVSNVLEKVSVSRLNISAVWSGIWKAYKDHRMIRYALIFVPGMMHVC